MTAIRSTPVLAPAGGPGPLPFGPRPEGAGIPARRRPEGGPNTAGLITGRPVTGGPVTGGPVNGRAAARLAAEALKTGVFSLQGQPGNAAHLAMLSRHYGLPLADLEKQQADPGLSERLGISFCLRHRILPLCRAGAVTLICTDRPDTFAGLREQTEARLGPVLLSLAPAEQIIRRLDQMQGRAIARRAENRVPAGESCRGFGGQRQILLALALLALALSLLLLSPGLIFLCLLSLTLPGMILGSLLKLAAAGLALRRAPPSPPASARPSDAPAAAALPKVSLIVPLYHEADIAPRLIPRLSRLDYPRDRIEVILAVEAGDQLTRAAIDQAGLPGWMRVVVIPPGRVKTKPRALNVALDHCDGTLIGIYDAEDAPEPDQIRRIVAQFREGGEKLACIQAVLDYYNPQTNWISRAFTLEYSAWFRLILPGIARAGLMVPLGGTSFFIRREVLESLGAWDSHNVTEDADLGVRLARHGWRTALSASVTREEANCRVLPWIRQRSRWIKGHMMTWAVHMRAPRRLWRETGPRAFLGFQVMFPCAALHCLFAPLLWSCWLMLAGLSLPGVSALPQPVTEALIAAMLGAAVIELSLALLARRAAGYRFSALWVLSLPFYQALASFAAWKALWEVIFHPFYWDKTAHGLFDPGAGKAAAIRLARP